MEIPYSAISAEARALAAETALLVKKYGVLEEQVQTLIKELKQVQRASPTHMLKPSEENQTHDEIIVFQGKKSHKISSFFGSLLRHFKN